MSEPKEDSCGSFKSLVGCGLGKSSPSFTSGFASIGPFSDLEEMRNENGV